MLRVLRNNLRPHRDGSEGGLLHCVTGSVMQQQPRLSLQRANVIGDLIRMRNAMSCAAEALHMRRAGGGGARMVQGKAGESSTQGAGAACPDPVILSFCLPGTVCRLVVPTQRTWLCFVEA